MEHSWGGARTFSVRISRCIHIYGSTNYPLKKVDVASWLGFSFTETAHAHGEPAKTADMNGPQQDDFLGASRVVWNLKLVARFAAPRATIVLVVEVLVLFLCPTMPLLNPQPAVSGTSRIGVFSRTLEPARYLTVVVFPIQPADLRTLPPTQPYPGVSCVFKRRGRVAYFFLSGLFVLLSS